MKNVLEIFNWAKERGDANISDRILVRILPELLKHDIQLSAEKIDNASELQVPEILYDQIKEIAEQLINDDHAGGSCHV